MMAQRTNPGNEGGEKNFSRKRFSCEEAIALGGKEEEKFVIGRIFLLQKIR